MSNKAGTSFSEDEYGKRLDRCVTDMTIKGCSGLLLGTVLSLVIFKRRSWPILVSSGMGLGIAYKTCENELNSKI